MLEISLIIFVIWIIYKIYSTFRELREARTKINSLTYENSDLAKQIDVLTQENTDAQAQISALQQEVHSLNATLSNKTAEINRLREKLYDLENENSDLRTQVKALTQDKANAQAKMRALQQEIHSLKAALTESERKLDFYLNIEAASANLNVPDDPVPASLKFVDMRAEDIPLDPEQASILGAIESTNNNFFITGKAGTGKSYLLGAFKKSSTKAHITLAPTGVAALNVEGTTLHSAFGYYNLVNLNVDDISEESIRLNSRKRIALKHASTIIIDEISMVRADTFDKIDRILRVINRNDKPFGGKQLLLFGDLFQLPPIAQPKERDYLLDCYGGIHFFYAHAYSAANFYFRELTINHRQKEDAAYFELLNRIRDGRISPDDIDALNDRVVRDISIYERYTTLLPTKAEAEAINQNHIQPLDSKEYTYHAQISYNKYPQKNRDLESSFPIVSTLRLKLGVLVMMVSNDVHHRWVNGTLGIVKALSHDRIFVTIENVTYEISPEEFTEQEIIYEHGKLFYDDVLTVVQYPIVPAYAMTIHKAQGKTFRNIICDISKCFEDGQAYVALSRCENLDGLHLAHRISPASIRVDKGVLDFYRKNRSQTH